MRTQTTQPKRQENIKKPRIKRVEFRNTHARHKWGAVDLLENALKELEENTSHRTLTYQSSSS